MSPIKKDLTILHASTQKPIRRADRIGEVYGRLRVIAVSAQADKVDVLCSCGERRTVYVRMLTTGKTKSCGCYRKEVLHVRQATHGMSGTPEYRIWAHMNDRCHNQKDGGYPAYGGRGIRVCERWRESFENFYADMGDKPAGMSLDRIDNSGGYGPANCRWATSRQQNINKRSNRVYDWFGKTIPLSVICEEVGANYCAVHSRITKLKWDFLKSVFTPTGAPACRP